MPSYANVARFHLATGGNCWIAVDEGEPVCLGPGDLILIPHGAGHVLSDSPNSPITHLDQVLAKSGYGGQGPLIYGDAPSGTETQLVCGHFEFGSPSSTP